MVSVLVMLARGLVIDSGKAGKSGKLEFSMVSVLVMLGGEPEPSISEFPAIFIWRVS